MKQRIITLTRRNFLFQALCSSAALALWHPLEAAAALEPRRPLALYHTHTGEALTLQLRQSGWSQSAYERLNRFLRDFRTGDEHPIDPKLLDILAAIQKKTGSQAPFEIISGYRSPKTNAMLRKRSGGVAKKSLHMQGKAIDIRLGDIKTSRLRDTAIAMQFGGVGYYRKSNFVHIDTGRFRTW